jgi:hypothetical protein
MSLTPGERLFAPECLYSGSGPKAQSEFGGVEHYSVKSWMSTAQHSPSTKLAVAGLFGSNPNQNLTGNFKAIRPFKLLKLLLDFRPRRFATGLVESVNQLPYVTGTTPHSANRVRGRGKTSYYWNGLN